MIWKGDKCILFSFWGMKMPWIVAFFIENEKNMHSSSNLENWRCDEKIRWIPIFLILKYKNALNMRISSLIMRKICIQNQILKIEDEIRKVNECLFFSFWSMKMPWIGIFLHWKWEKYKFITKFRLLKMRKLIINYIII